MKNNDALFGSVMIILSIIITSFDVCILSNFRCIEGYCCIAIVTCLCFFNIVSSYFVATNNYYELNTDYVEEEEDFFDEY